MTDQTNLFQEFQTDFDKHFKQESMSLQEFLELAAQDKSVYASPHERMLTAIGPAKLVDTKTDSRLSRIFSNRIIRTYETFSEFYGLEETIDQIVSFFRHAAQGLEESKQILYLLGPVGGGKSSIAERLKELMEQVPVYVVEDSPVFDSPLSLFYPREKYGDLLEQKFGISRLAVRSIPSPWLLEKLKEFNGDISKFRVNKIYPSRLKQVCITRTEPGDENNQDISALVGKVDIRQLERYAQNHPYAYSYSGGLNRGNNGICEMVEMFKSPIKMLHPLLTATQDKHYKGTEAIPSMPFDGVILAHSNESEWQQFKNNKTNEAFLDRINVIQIPYCLRVNEEVEIYRKLLRNSELSKAPCAPGTLEYLAQYSVLSRLKTPDNSLIYSKMRVYNGENIKDVDPKAKPLQEYKEAAGVMEGMDGVSTRFAFKVLSKVFNHDAEEIAADPIHLMAVLERETIKEQYPEEREHQLISFNKSTLKDEYLKFLEKEIRASFLDSFRELCQNVFERYFYYADAWVQDSDFRDPDTGVMLDRDDLHKELSKLETAAEITNYKDWRNEIVQFVLRHNRSKGGMPTWNSYAKMRDAIERHVLVNTEELLPVISFAPKRNDEDKKKHEQFVEKMKDRGYTPRQTQRVCEWYARVKKSS
jgi:serine protein kinase